MREIYAPELPESGEASDRRVLFPRPSWDSGVVVAAVCRQLLVLPAPSGVVKARLHFPGPVCIRRGLSQVTSYSVLLRTYAKYWYAKTGTLKPSHHVPENPLAQRKSQKFRKKSAKNPAVKIGKFLLDFAEMVQQFSQND